MRLVTAFENMSTPIPLDRFFCFVVESLILVTQIILLDDDIIEFAFILINPSLETNFDRFGANDRLDTRQIHRAIIMSYEKRAAGGKMANQIGPKNVVGRDKLIDSVWRKLETNSLRFTAERRVGKTTVMTKMSAEPQPGYHVFFMDVEGICEHNKDTKILLIFDELPYMLQKIASIGRDNESKTQAITLLDTLRSVRQKYTNLRMIYAGSVGLHHVLNDITGKPLRDDDIARAILDHMATLTHPQSIEQIWNVVKSSFQLNDRNHIVNLLKSLALDHYLNCDQTKRYYFRFPLIQKWWKLAQGLEG